MMRAVFSGAALAAGLIAGQAVADDAAYKIKITAESFLRGDIYTPELCSNHRIRLQSTPLGGRLNAFCDAAYKTEPDYSQEYEECRAQSKQREKDFADQAPALNEAQKQKLETQIVILNGACQNVAIETHQKKVGALFREHFPQGITMGYWAP